MSFLLEKCNLFSFLEAFYFFANLITWLQLNPHVKCTPSLATLLQSSASLHCFSHKTHTNAFKCICFPKLCYRILHPSNRASDQAATVFHHLFIISLNYNFSLNFFFFVKIGSDINFFVKMRLKDILQTH